MSHLEKLYYRIVMGVLAVIAVTCWVLVWHNLRSQDQTTTPATTSASDVLDQRTMHWPVCQFMGDDAPTDPTVEGCGFFKLSEEPITFPRPTERDQRIFWERVRAPSEYDSMPGVPCEPLSEAQLDHFEQARTIVLTSTEPRGAWRWDDVRFVTRMIGEFDRATGRGVVLCLQTEEVGGDIPHGAYAFFSGKVSFSTEALQMDHEALAAILIHEATHVVYHASLTVDTHATAQEDLALAILQCGDIRAVERQANESLSYLNEYLWSGEHRLPSHPQEGAIWETTKSARAGNLHARLLFAQHVWSMTLSQEVDELLQSFNLSDDELTDLRHTTDLACGPFPYFGLTDGGPHYVSPTDGEPEFLPDMVELMEMGIEDICKLDSLFLEFDHPCSTNWLYDPEADTDAFNRIVLGI